MGEVTCDARLGPGWERRRLPCCWGKERMLGCKAGERKETSRQINSSVSTQQQSIASRERLKKI